ncbi:dipeptidase [Tuberibacillus sp. Marseille-P3662]|uniref:dipeptidase n=1 Tax=Tuberibacillus sp. Marseille-P3662 TaxID=1965358 RepID=UPI000A1CB746|nr:dipeptidase [Tuberibacillus sp. Marseille-P3662]
MKLFDAHCDVLYKMHLDSSVDFARSDQLHIDLESLRSSGAKVQCFALFVPDTVPQEIKFKTVLDMIDIFHEKIIAPYDDVVHVRSKREIAELGEGQIGAMLTLEGCDAIDTDPVKMRTLFRLGVRAVGLTWNNANAVADGAQESRWSGLTDFGREVVRMNNDFNVWTDVSHLSEPAFWDVLDIAKYPMASHSNCKTLCDHPRNLTDEQIKALLAQGGVMGVTFVPDFLNTSGEANIQDILYHVDHICSLGGGKQIGFGSDFDGIDHTPEHLSSYADYHHLIDLLLKHYSEDQVQGFLFNNFYAALPKSI